MKKISMKIECSLTISIEDGRKILMLDRNLLINKVYEILGHEFRLKTVSGIKATASIIEPTILELYDSAFSVINKAAQQDYAPDAFGAADL